jgi:hypothetical protein
VNIPDDADISCHLQEISRGIIRCLVPNESRVGNTDRVTAENCYKCEVGKIYREVGCDQLTPDIVITQQTVDQPVGYLARVTVTGINCGRRLRQTTLDQCRVCSLVPAETTKELVTATLGLFQAQGFTSAYSDLLEARNDTRDGDYDDAIGKAISGLESTMICVHEKVAADLPSVTTLTNLWKSTKVLLRFDEITTGASGNVVPLVGSLSGLIGHLGAMRNALSDSHGKGLVPAEVSEAIAELAINAAATMSTVIVRRYKQLEAELA